MPPFIPTITGPDDTSNFDSFDPLQDDSFSTGAKRSTGFSGRSLPFVGFTYTGIRSCDSSSRSCDSCAMKADLDVCRRESSTSAQERYSSLERECVVYKSQLEVTAVSTVLHVLLTLQDLQRKLDIERNDRRVSDSRALQLLAEIKEKARVAEDLRQTEARYDHCRHELYSTDTVLTELLMTSNSLCCCHNLNKRRPSSLGDYSDYMLISRRGR